MTAVLAGHWMATYLRISTRRVLKCSSRTLPARSLLLISHQDCSRPGNWKLRGAPAAGAGGNGCFRAACAASVGNHRDSMASGEADPKRPKIVGKEPFGSGQLLTSPKTVGPPPFPILPASTPYEISRVMQPDDTNPSGNVHGGTILKLIENAGAVVSTRHCNKHRATDEQVLTTGLARVDHTDFHLPMFVNEVAQLQAAVTYASPRSLEVTVDVWAENLLTGTKRHTNAARLWYVAVPVDQDLHNTREMTPVPVPPLEGLTPEEMEEGRKRYEMQKASRAEDSRVAMGCNHLSASPPHPEAQEHTVLASQTTLANIVLPSDCTSTGHFTGGSLMKMMDNAAGICAARHARARPVTACIDAIDFHSPIRNGEIVFVTARMVFISSRSMEIEVTTEAEGIKPGSRRITNTAYFTFVSLDQNCCALPVPVLRTIGEEEEQRFQEGKKRYLERKAARQAIAKQPHRQSHHN